ncbi:MAG: hypothetical protein C4523_14870 [Myxococcales bacterium]|nr:MAG: hypothetical protein C4523_14870 [Myxococcales bacterium]
MPSIRIKQALADGVYFITPTVRRWYYLFDRFQRWEILAQSLRFCRENKKVRLYGYVFMLNHLHLIVHAPDVAGFVHAFKRFTSRALLDNVRTHEPKALELFETEQGSHEIWRRTNMPELIEEEKFFRQKLEYIHNNPVRKQYVYQPEDWYWSSARYYLRNEPGPIPLDPLEL